MVRVEVNTGVLTADTTRAVGVVLPIRTDLAALHAALERHLGLQAATT